MHDGADGEHRRLMVATFFVLLFVIAAATHFYLGDIVRVLMKQ